MSDELKRLRTITAHDEDGGLGADVEWAVAEIERLRSWVADLQSGMYINCVYCGHRYGPREDTPVAMAEVLKEHIAQCPEHPLSHANAEIERLRAIVDQLRDAASAVLALRETGVCRDARNASLQKTLKDIGLAILESGEKP